MQSIDRTYQIRPDDHLLWEAEYPEPSTPQGAVKHVARIGHHVVALKYSKTKKIFNLSFFVIIYCILSQGERGQ